MRWTIPKRIIESIERWGKAKASANMVPLNYIYFLNKVFLRETDDWVI